jgi:signal transduction histidine kinase
MKLFPGVLQRKRGIVFFVAAFMLPLVLVVLVSIDTFSKRQMTTRNLLESNLWLSGRSALDRIEGLFIENENKWLNAEYFSGTPGSVSLWRNDTTPDHFLVDQEFSLVFPETAEENELNLLTVKGSWPSDYRSFMDRAETEELARRNYSNAAENYRAGLGVARTPRQEALAIEGLARSGMAGQNYRQAIRYYQVLRNEYSHTGNQGGHPYGITSPLQLYTIGTLTGEDVFGHDSLLTSYQMLRNGNWLISPSSYLFFKSAYESALDIETEKEISRFEKVLDFNQFLNDLVIPVIKERSVFSELYKAGETRRTYLQKDDAQYLVSFKEMPLPGEDRLYYGGIRWNLDTVLSGMLPDLLADLSEETGLEFLVLNDQNINLSTDEAELIPDESLALAFSTIPIPWTLVTIQPGYEKLQSDVRIQLIIYVLLIAIIILLMFFGVFVLLRDIKRETESVLHQTEFVHNVSHELKTPLSLIRLYGETLLLKDQLPEADRKEGLQIITKESERLSYMINNILDFSKIEMGRKEFNLKPGNLAELVLSTLDSYRYHFVKKGFRVEEEIEKDMPLVMFDKEAVEGILINLYSNAIKFSNSTKHMTVRLLNSQERICLEVSDKGIGIPPH